MSKVLIGGNSKYRLSKVSDDSWTDVIIICIASEHFGDTGDKMNTELAQSVCYPFTFCELCVMDWDKYLTPWKANINMKNREFQGDGRELLDCLEAEIIPTIRKYAKNAKIYIAQHKIKKFSIVYLSLGNKEKNTKHPLMRYVEENMILQNELLEAGSYVNHTLLAWNDGGHFNDTTERLKL